MFSISLTESFFNFPPNLARNPSSFLAPVKTEIHRRSRESGNPPSFPRKRESTVVPAKTGIHRRSCKSGNPPSFLQKRESINYFWTGGYLSYSGWGFLGGITFVREDQVDRGVLSHELAHLLGQRKDFYDQEGKQQQKCRRFSGDELIPCAGYKIPRALDSWVENGQRHWNFVQDRYSIMDNKNEPDIEENILEELWIDRESHQRVFSPYAKVSSVFDHLQNKIHLSEKKIKPKKLLVSGFYDKKRNRFLSPQLRVLETDGVTPSLSKDWDVKEVPLVSFHVKNREGSPLQTIRRPAFDVESRFLYEGGKSRECGSKSFGLSMVSAIFNLSELRTSPKDIKLSVFGPEGEEIFSSLLPED